MCCLKLFCIHSVNTHIELHILISHMSKDDGLFTGGFTVSPLVVKGLKWWLRYSNSKSNSGNNLQDSKAKEAINLPINSLDYWSRVKALCGQTGEIGLQWSMRDSRLNALCNRESGLHLSLSIGFALFTPNHESTKDVTSSWLTCWNTHETPLVLYLELGWSKYGSSGNPILEFGHWDRVKQCKMFIFRYFTQILKFWALLLTAWLVTASHC